MAGKPIIEVKNVTVRYGDRTILKDISFDVNRGEILAIVGGSGSGKSTLLRQMIGLEIPIEGNVFIDGEDLTSAIGEKRRQIKRKFGVLFQSGGLFASMTIAENMALALQSYTELPDERIARINDLKLKSVGLSGINSILPSEISGGMKKIAGIARAMALDPQILFLDEPSSGLDPVTAASLDKLINELNQSLGTTMVVITHDLASIFEIAQYIIMLDKDSTHIIARGTPDEMKEMQDIESVYKFFNRIPV